MNTRRTTLFVAILLALGTGWLTFNYLSSVNRASQAAGEPRDVLVATQDIPARMTITPVMFRHEVRPASALEPDAISSPARAVGALALITIPAGSQITSSKVGQPSELALPVRLRPGMRAVSIAIDKVKGVSGLAQPGDRVDVIAIPPRQGNSPPVAMTIMRGIRILALGTTLENASATPSPDEQNSTTVTLEVTPKQADLLAAADANTTLRLSLRSPKERIRSEPVEGLGNFGWAPDTSQAQQPAAQDATAFEKSLATALVRPLPAGGAAPAAVAPTRASAARAVGGVQIIDGDQVTTRPRT